MSNVIKYPFVDIRGKEAVIIDNNNNDSFVPLFHKQDMNAAPGVDSDVMQFKTISQIEAEKVLAGSNPEKPDGDSGFKSGLPVTDLNELIQERHREAEDKADRLIADAKEKAAKITRDAEIAADAARTSDTRMAWRRQNRISSRRKPSLLRAPGCSVKNTRLAWLQLREDM